MKKSSDPRHLKRIRVLKELFTWKFNKETKFSESQTKQILAFIPIIDEAIAEAAPQWPIDQVNSVDLAILRLSIFELIINKDAPFKVIVDEAVELGKEFGGESSAAFINGVLGKVISSHNLDNSNSNK